MKPSLPTAYFDALYAADPDPWRFATSGYERDKYAATLAALPSPRYRAALEIGCSIGVLTRALSDRCDHLLAVDLAEGALAQAGARCADRPQVRIARMQVPGEWPPGRFDLILLSELLYFLSLDDIAAAAAAVRGSLDPGGTCLLVHWTGPTDYPTGGDAAVQAFIATCGLPVLQARRAEHYRLDLLGSA